MIAQVVPSFTSLPMPAPSVRLLQVSLHLWENGSEIPSSHSVITSERGRGAVRDVHPGLHGSTPATDWSLPASITFSIPTYTTVSTSGSATFANTASIAWSSHHHPVHRSQQCSTIFTPASTLSVPASITLKHLNPPAESCISKTYQSLSPCPSQPHHPVCASKHHPRASILASITLSLPRVPHSLCQSEINNFSLEDPPHNWTGLFFYTHTVGLCSQLQARAEGT